MTTAGYSGTPLARKLGITPESRVLLAGRPPGWEMGQLPAGVTLHSRRQGSAYDVILAFCLDLDALRRRWPRLHPSTTTAGALWICWPKRASRRQTDLSENTARDFGLGHGRVDVKVCAVDETWSALKFVIRLTDRPAAADRP